MATLPQCINRCVPQPVGVAVNQNVFVLGDGSAEIYLADFPDVSGTLVTLELPYPAIAGYAPQVFINGVLQVSGQHYNWIKAPVSGKDAISFTPGVSLDHSNIQVHYARDMREG